MMHVIDLAGMDTRLKRAARNEYAGPCPDIHCVCQTDGFRVKLTKNERDGEYRGGFMCRGCWDPSNPPKRSGWKGCTRQADPQGLNLAELIIPARMEWSGASSVCELM